MLLQTKTSIDGKLSQIESNNRRSAAWTRNWTLHAITDKDVFSAGAIPWKPVSFARNLSPDVR
jgi:hypothetical protein